MGILLNAKEIEVLSEAWLEADEDVDWAETLLRAQLKKVKQYWDDYGIIKLDEVLTKAVNETGD